MNTTTTKSATEPNRSLFSIRRILLMLRHYALLHRTSWLIGLLVIVLVPITIMLLIIIFVSDPSVFMNNQSKSGWLTIYTIAGLLLTSNLFIDIHKPGQSWFTLTLPASPGKKYWSAWLISGPIYTIVAMLVIFGLSIITGLFRTVFDVSFTLFNPFTSEVMRQIMIYHIFHALFLWGAVWWNKLSFLYSLLLVVAILASGVLLIFLSVQAIEFILPDNYLIDLGSPFYESGLRIATSLLWLFSWLFFLFWGADCYARKERLS
ncbi:MAG: hypothetical protein LAT67_08275 [Balneolales bacterium]|nr:hypothetical protein [Balneolales bacterium]